MDKPIKDPAHPLAKKNGYVPATRHALYAQLGEGPHKCYTCPKMLSWAEILVSDIDGQARINCMSCVRIRHHHRPIPADAPIYINRNGRRSLGVERTCERCQKPFVVEASNARNNPKVGRFCSGSCRSIFTNLEAAAKRRAAKA